MLGQIGPILGLSWAHVGSMLALCWPILALSWPMLSLSWPYVGPMLAYVGLMLAHLGAYVEAMVAICDTISVERPPRRTPPRNQKQGKTTFFFKNFRQQKNCERPSAQSTVKNDVFGTSDTRNTVNYGAFRRSG